MKPITIILHRNIASWQPYENCFIRNSSGRTLRLARLMDEPRKIRRYAPPTKAVIDKNPQSWESLFSTAAGRFPRAKERNLDPQRNVAWNSVSLPDHTANSGIARNLLAIPGVIRFKAVTEIPACLRNSASNLNLGSIGLPRSPNALTSPINLSLNPRRVSRLSYNLFVKNIWKVCDDSAHKTSLLIG